MAVGTIPLLTCMNPGQVTQEGIFLPCSRGICQYLSISVNICPALHPALQLLYFSLVTKLMQVCRISPYGWQGWDDAAELQSSSVGRRAHHQGCPWS